VTLPREKAVLTLTRGLAGGESSLTVIVTQRYAYGTNDVIELSNAIDLFRKVGGKEIVDACNQRYGIQLVACNRHHEYEQSTSLRTSVIKRCLSAKPLAFVPASIKLNLGHEDTTRLASAFMEGVQWLLSGNAVEESRGLEVFNGQEECILECARIVSYDVGVMLCLC
jgi:hypothetical protein